MNNIFRVPVDNQHFKDTIEAGKSVEAISRFFDGSELAQVKRIAKEGLVRYWGSIPGEANKRTFEKLAEADELLFYRSGKYIALAEVSLKTVNPQFAKWSWGNTENGATWELVYFLRNVQFIEIDSAEINREFGFADGPVMGFSPISEDKLKEFRKKHANIDDLIRSLGYEQKVQEKISEEISKLPISTPFEAQFYLVDLGNQLEYDTYVPPTDAGRTVKEKRLDDLITVHKEDLNQYVAPVIFDPLSNIDVIWFKEHYRPKFFYEVVFSTGMTEAFARLEAVAGHYDTAKTRIVGSKEKEAEFEKARRLHFPESSGIAYKDFGALMNAHSETANFHKIIDTFLR